MSFSNEPEVMKTRKVKPDLVASGGGALARFEQIPDNIYRVNLSLLKTPVSLAAFTFLVLFIFGGFFMTVNYLFLMPLTGRGYVPKLQQVEVREINKAPVRKVPR